MDPIHALGLISVHSVVNFVAYFQKTTLQHLGPVTDVAYSPDGQYLVACDANRKVCEIDLKP